MSTVKTKINSNEVLTFLQKNVDQNILKVHFIKGGEMSQAFAFNSDDNELVIRINKKSYSFEKDTYAYDHFNNSHIPIPKIIEMGRFDIDLFYAISQKAPGQTLDRLGIETNKILLPQLISVHDAIRNTKIEGNGTFGDWGSNGNAEFDTWNAYLTEKKDDVYGNWDMLYKKTFLEPEPVEKITQKINQLLDFLPNERYLIHGDYGGNNMTSDEEKITGVLDWGESKYGDFVYDVAWLQFYFDDIPYEKIFFKHYENTGVNVANYNERILCYQLHIGLGGIGFFALSGQKEPYQWAKKKLLKLLVETGISK